MPILGRGTGTSLSGQTCNVAVVLDFSKYMNRILELDPEGRQTRVEPGGINDQLRHAAMQYGIPYDLARRNMTLLAERVLPQLQAVPMPRTGGTAAQPSAGASALRGAPSRRATSAAIASHSS